MPNGIILKGIGGFYYVQTSNGLLECKARGVLRNKNIVPMPGDMVEIKFGDELGKGVIAEILPRKTVLIRPSVANISQLFIVLSCKRPLPDLLLADKLIISAFYNKIKPILIINKTDLNNNEIEEISAQYNETGLDIFYTSTVIDSDFNSVLEKMENQINAFAGQSGVGKSSILNALIQKFVMNTGTLSERSQRGKHTTRHAELFCVGTNGYLLDTPGFSSYELESVPYEMLWSYYPEMQPYGNQCKFTGCLHLSEPDCAVKEQVLHGKINSGRYERYQTILLSLMEKHKNRWR